MKTIFIIELIFILTNCFAHDITNEEEQKNLVYLDSLFLRYGHANNTMYASELKLFLKNFFFSLVNEFENGFNINFTNQENLNCIKSKANAFINIASHLKDDILINGTNFNKLSSLLITNLDICFNYSDNQFNHSLKNNSNSYFKQSILSLIQPNRIKNNLLSISKEGKNLI